MADAFPKFSATHYNATVVLEADTHADLLQKSVICHLSLRNWKTESRELIAFSLMTVLTDDSIFPLIFSFSHNFIAINALLFNCSTVVCCRISLKNAEIFALFSDIVYLRARNN